MEGEIRRQRFSAVERLKRGENPEASYTSLGRSKAWLYKWIGRYLENDDA